MGRRPKNNPWHLTRNEWRVLDGIRLHQGAEGIHGWELRKRLQETLGPDCPPKPTLYRVLSRLEKEEMLHRKLVHPTDDHRWPGPPRQLFRVTDRGLEALRRYAEEHAR